MRHLSVSDYRRTAWKNGGGETLELAIFPPGADLDGFDWRISMARIERDGPFSSFPGMDRTILMQAGRGMTLTIDGAETALALDDPPFRFSGDGQTWCRLWDGPVTDINIMSRRSVRSHVVTRIGADATVTGKTQAMVLAMTLLSLDSYLGRIVQGDLLVLEPGESLTLQSGHALAIHFICPGA